MYLFDHRQGEVKVKGQTLREWFIQNLTISPTGLLHPAIDGFYIGERMLLICRYRCTNVTVCSV